MERISSRRQSLYDHVDTSHSQDDEDAPNTPTNSRPRSPVVHVRPARPLSTSPRFSIEVVEENRIAFTVDHEKPKSSSNRLWGDSQDVEESDDNVPTVLRKWENDIVGFDGKKDPANPKNWTYSKKIAITVLLGLTTMCSTFTSSIFSPAVRPISEEFGPSLEVSLLGISLYVAGFVPGPILWAPCSELYGRKISIIAPMFVFICLTAGTATAKDLQTIMITRFFAGVCASAPVTTVGGGLSDMFTQEQRGTAVVFYSLAVMAGPALGPVIGAALLQSSLGWRWTSYLIVIMTSVIVTLGVLILPETFAPVILTRKARKLRLETGRWALHSQQETQKLDMHVFLKIHLLRPLRMMVLEPMLLCITVFNSFAFGILYLLFAAVPIIYEEGRGWGTFVGALPFLSVLVGTTVAAGINILYSQRVFAPHFKKNGGHADPEMRLPPMMIGGIAFPIGFFLLGWTSYPSISWVPSVIGLGFIGMSFLLIFQSGLNYLIDAYTKYAASAVGANTFLRSIFAAILPLAAPPLFHNLGVNWACTILGGIGAVLAFVPFVFFAYGKRLRAKSKMMALLTD